MRTARMLNDVVEQFQREQHRVIENPRIVVRVYADVTDVSKKLAKIKVVGLEKRSLMPFAAGFTRALGGFDFVDTLDEEGTKIKIRGKQYISKGRTTAYCRTQTKGISRKSETEGPVFGYKTDTAHRCI